MSASATASTSRSRPQARKKANDDASYFGPSTSTASAVGSKRQAADKLDGEPRVKRKRVDAAATAAQTAAAGKSGTVESEVKLSMVEFNKMPIPALERYLTQFDIIPTIYPSPLLPNDPPPPSLLGTTPRVASRAPSPPANQTPANRPRRESREPNRRSSRLLDDAPPHNYTTPTLTELIDLQGVLAKIVEKHFREQLNFSARDELDALAAFMTAVEKSRGPRPRPNSFA